MISLTNPVLASQSSCMVHSLLSPWVACVFSHFLLRPSATTFNLPGTCLMSTMWYAKISSLYLACATFMFELSSVSFIALQSVSILMGKPQMMLENLSNPNFSAANSNKYDLYFLSIDDICFNAKPNGCIHSTHFPAGVCVFSLFDNTAVKPSRHPSEVIMKCDPSYLRACNTGLDVIAVLRSKNVLVCSWVQIVCKYSPTHIFNVYAVYVFSLILIMIFFNFTIWRTISHGLHPLPTWIASKTSTQSLNALTQVIHQMISTISTKT